VREKKEMKRIRKVCKGGRYRERISSWFVSFPYRENLIYLSELINSSCEEN